MGCETTEEKPNELSPNQENSKNRKDLLLLGKNESKNISIDKFIEDALKRHNELRINHGVNPLKISEDLNKIAQKFAEFLAEKNKIIQSGNIYKGEDLGENIFCCSGNEIQGDLMTMSWYDEIKEYDFNNPGFKSEAGHFTQIIWKDTKEVGFGFAKSNNGVYYGVGNYFPAGNIDTKEEFINNVLKRK